MPTYTEKNSPGYIESSSSTKNKTKEDIRYSQLLPAHILEDAPMLDNLLKAYYTFLNLDEFIISVLIFSSNVNSSSCLSLVL